MVPALMLALGREHGGPIWEQLSTDEIKELSACIASLGRVPSVVVEHLLIQFSGEVSSMSSLHGSFETTERLLEGLLPVDVAISPGWGAALGGVVVGTWVAGASMALKKRVLASNPKVNLFHRGFKACDDYRGGEEAMAKVQCPVLFVLGRKDSMTLPKMAQPLQAKALDARTVLVDGGHQMMAEAPDEVLFALKNFLKG